MMISLLLQYLRFVMLSQIRKDYKYEERGFRWKEMYSHFPDKDTQDHRLLIQSQNFGKTAVHFGRLLHLIADVNLSELFEETQQRKFQLLTVATLSSNGYFV